MIENHKILATGQMDDKIYFIKQGRVDIYVKQIKEMEFGEIEPADENKNEWLYLTTLEKGSCFNFVSSILQRPSIFEFVGPKFISKKHDESETDDE